MKIEQFKKYFCMVLHLEFTEEKNGKKKYIYIFKQIPPLLITNYFLFD